MPTLRILATKITPGTHLLVDNTDVRLRGTRRTRPGTKNGTKVVVARVTRLERFRRGQSNVIRILTTAGPLEDSPNGGHTLAQQDDVDRFEAALKVQREIKQAIAEAHKRREVTGKCELDLPIVWRDEDVAMVEPRLLAIRTCQRTPEHADWCSARGEEEIQRLRLTK